MQRTSASSRPGAGACLLLSGPMLDRSGGGEWTVHTLLDPLTPGKRRRRVQGSARLQSLNPVTGDEPRVKNSKLRPVVLETLPFLAAPYRHQVFSRVTLNPRHSQPAEDRIPAFVPF